MQENRLKTIFRTSIIAICINVALGIFKAIVGFISHSIAITTDAVNNFTDAASSLITILGAYFATKTPDKKHPFGYGRIEYLGTLIIGGLILYAGITAFIESVKKIINPEPSDYSTLILIILAVAVLVKAFLAFYVSRVGKRINSDSLMASGKEAIADIAISVATIVAALIYIFTGIAIEAWLGVIIAAIIVKAGIETLRETVGKILGTGVEVSLVQNIKKSIAEHDNVLGAYDLVLHNYGPDSYLGSVHVAVPDTMTIDEFDILSRKIQDDTFTKFGIYLSSVGLYCINTKNEEIVKLKDEITKIALQNSGVNQLHGFHANLANKDIRFDLVISFEPKNRQEVYEQAVKNIQTAFPDYSFNIGLDSDYNECL